MPGGAPLEHEAGQAASGQPPARVGGGAVSGSDDEGHGGAQPRHRGEAATEFKPGPRHEEKAGHRQQAVPGDVLGVPRTQGHPGKEDRPGAGRAESFEVAGEVGEEPRVV
jgi:hypothetical protein